MKFQRHLQDYANSQFLSHLSGDEEYSEFFPNWREFLSHLSGDEVYNG